MELGRQRDILPGYMATITLSKTLGRWSVVGSTWTWTWTNESRAANSTSHTYAYVTFLFKYPSLYYITRGGKVFIHHSVETINVFRLSIGTLDLIPMVRLIGSSVLWLLRAIQSKEKLYE